jgi:protein involved in polysaccharide export with SLBB domain
LQFTQRIQNGNAQNIQNAGGVGFAPLDSAPVSADYLLGPGDQVLVRSWGSVDIDVKAIVDRNGMITLPRVGAIPMAGVKAAQADGIIRSAIGKYYKDFEISVTLFNLRAITVYVVGQARRPGSYTISGASTLASGLFATGGPAPNGSVRHVQLKRAGQIVREFDLYQFLSSGNSSGDIKLIDGDVIVIPPAAGYVALVGTVNNPAVYELARESETLAQLLSVAGGLPVTANQQRVTLERLDPSKAQPRSVENFALADKAASTALKNGDVLTVQSIVPELGNAVTLRGHVAQPIRLPWRQGLRIRDLIPNREALINRESVRQQNETLFDENQRKRIFSDEVATDASQRVSPESVGQLFDEINWDYAVVERINRGELTTALIPFNLARILADANSPDNMMLQAGDVVTVFSAEDVRVPVAKRRVMVRVEGEVNNPGYYQLKSGEDLLSLLQKSGGLTSDAYLFGAGLYRDEVRKSQTENLQKLIRRLDAEGNSRVLSLSQNLGASSDATLAQARIMAAQMQQRQTLERLRNVKPEGRIALNLEPNLNNYIDQLPTLRLINGDRFVVPSRPDFVYVYGSVNTESALLFKPNMTVTDYLMQSGVGAGADRDAVIVVRANGSAVTTNNERFGSVGRLRLMPGDAIIVPYKIDLETGWSTFIRNTKDITQILYQLGIGAAAFKALGY